MKRNRFKKNGLHNPDQLRARAGRDRRVAERAALALSFRASLEAQYRASVGAPTGALSAAVEALLNAAVSTHVEIVETTKRFLDGRARNPAMERMNNARGELRRCLRSLGLVSNVGDAGTNEDSGPPLNATDEQKRAWSQEYVKNRLAEGKAAAQ
jgi:hypothetical protein